MGFKSALGEIASHLHVPIHLKRAVIMLAGGLVGVHQGKPEAVQLIDGLDKWNPEVGHPLEMVVCVHVDQTQRSSRLWWYFFLL